MESIRELSRQLFKDVDPKQANELYEQIIEEVRLGAKDVGISVHPIYIEDMAKHMFSDVTPDHSLTYLHNIIDDFRRGVHGLGLPAYGTVAVADFSSVAIVVDRMIKYIADNNFSEDDAEIIWDFSVPYGDFVAAVPDVEVQIFEHSRLNDLVSYGDDMFDRIYEGEKDFAEAVFYKLEPQQQQKLTDLVAAHIEKHKDQKHGR